MEKRKRLWGYVIWACMVSVFPWDSVFPRARHVLLRRRRVRAQRAAQQVQAMYYNNWLRANMMRMNPYLGLQRSMENRIAQPSAQQLAAMARNQFESEWPYIMDQVARKIADHQSVRKNILPLKKEYYLQNFQRAVSLEKEHVVADYTRTYSREFLRGNRRGIDVEPFITSLAEFFNRRFEEGFSAVQSSSPVTTVVEDETYGENQEDMPEKEVKKRKDDLDDLADDAESQEREETEEKSTTTKDDLNEDV